MFNIPGSGSVMETNLDRSELQKKSWTPKKTYPDPQHWVQYIHILCKSLYFTPTPPLTTLFYCCHMYLSIYKNVRFSDVIVLVPGGAKFTRS